MGLKRFHAGPASNHNLSCTGGEKPLKNPVKLWLDLQTSMKGEIPQTAHKIWRNVYLKADTNRYFDSTSTTFSNQKGGQ